MFSFFLHVPYYFVLEYAPLKKQLPLPVFKEWSLYKAKPLPSAGPKIPRACTSVMVEFVSVNSQLEESTIGSPAPQPGAYTLFLFLLSA